MHSSTGFAPNVMLFGRNVNLNRGIFKDRGPMEKLVECPRYVRDLVRMQEEILKSSQETFADQMDRRVMKRQENTGPSVRMFKENELVITVREVGSKLDYKWKGPFKVIKKLFANVYEIEDLRTKKRICRDVSSLRSFICPEGVDPLVVAGQDEGEYVVRAIEGRRLEGKKKNNKTHWYFLVQLEDGTEDWFPYMEVRDLEVFDGYLRHHRDFARMLKLKVSD